MASTMAESHGSEFLVQMMAAEIKLRHANIVALRRFVNEQEHIAYSITPGIQSIDQTFNDFKSG